MASNDLLRRAFSRMASSNEAYFVLRSRFVQSHSYMCIAQYILGIGDRHLDNTLIDMTTGACVGIDFGHAFGSATQLLGVPELVPFRLTHQMLTFLSPIKDASPYKQYMMSALHALRKQSALLLNTMDVFIQEPLLDWQKYALKLEARMKSSNEKGKTNVWDPRFKVNVCKMKLSGINPAYIMSQDLEYGVFLNNKSLNRKVQAVAEGDPHQNYRAAMLKATKDPSTHVLNVEEQVDCLVDLATDKNVIGRIFSGWSPWI
ncbi:DNA-dependent protein kinase catalytic subunit-like [Clytia hemisphaerica]|uniref:DNA-dependent protein kinase catalytic subunit-like n=1 Tax=Clytia hemisphaerica TaxID=252671 RepID=UPI0034D6FE2E